jgi:hypothetical protein
MSITASISQQNSLVLNVPNDLITSALVQKLMYLIRLRELSADNKMTDEQATELAETIQKKWWEENKNWFLKDVQL